MLVLYFNGLDFFLKAGQNLAVGFFNISSDLSLILAVLRRSV